MRFQSINIYCIFTSHPIGGSINLQWLWSVWFTTIGNGLDLQSDCSYCLWLFQMDFTDLQAHRKSMQERRRHLHSSWPLTYFPSARLLHQIKPLRCLPEPCHPAVYHVIRLSLHLPQHHSLLPGNLSVLNFLCWAISAFWGQFGFGCDTFFKHEMHYVGWML